jgi:hypothetical protein
MIETGFDADAPLAISCPNCRQPMHAQDLEHNYQGLVRVDLCFACAGIWFDHLASVQLAPAAVIELFKEIHSHRDATRQPLSARQNCPRCSNALVLSYDLGKAGRFSYYRCLRDHGRFTPFFQFLREKQFVRSLTAVELQRVRLQVRQITCSECGAPIDLEHSSECQYCHAPVSFLDPEAVQKAASMWAEAVHRRHLAPSPEILRDSLGRIQLAHVDQSVARDAHLGSVLLAGSAAAAVGGHDSGRGVDLVAFGMSAIGRLFAGND